MARLFQQARNDWRALWPALACWLLVLAVHGWFRLHTSAGDPEARHSWSRWLLAAEILLPGLIALMLTVGNGPRGAIGRGEDSPWRWTASRLLTCGLWLVALPAALDALCYWRDGFGAVNTARMTLDALFWRTTVALLFLAVGASARSWKYVPHVIVTMGLMLFDTAALVSWAAEERFREVTTEDWPDFTTRRIYWLSLPALAICAASLIGSRFPRFRRAAYGGPAVAVGLVVVAFVFWPAEFSPPFSPRVVAGAPPRPEAGKTLIYGGDFLVADITLSRDAAPWIRAGRESTVVRSGEGAAMGFRPFAESPPHLYIPSTLEAVKALRPSNPGALLSGRPAPSLRPRSCHLGRVSPASGNVRFLLETGGFGPAWRTELPVTPGAEARANGFLWRVRCMESDDPAALAARGGGVNQLRFEEWRPSFFLPFGGASAAGLTGQTYRFPSPLLWLPEGNLVFRTGLARRPAHPLGRPWLLGGRMDCYFAVLDPSDLLEKVRKAAPDHPILRLGGEKDPAIWNHVRVVLLEWEVVSYGTQEIRLPLPQ